MKLRKSEFIKILKEEAFKICEQRTEAQSLSATDLWLRAKKARMPVDKVTFLIQALSVLEQEIKDDPNNWTSNYNFAKTSEELARIAISNGGILDLNRDNEIILIRKHIKNAKTFYDNTSKLLTGAQGEDIRAEINQKINKSLPELESIMPVTLGTDIIKFKVMPEIRKFHESVKEMEYAEPTKESLLNAHMGLQVLVAMLPKEYERLTKLIDEIN